MVNFVTLFGWFFKGGLRQSLLSRSLKLLHHSAYQSVLSNEKILISVQLLVENGADVNLDVENVDSALIEAVRMQDFEIVTFLLKSKADINHKGIQGLTALHVQLMQRPISRYRGNFYIIFWSLLLSFFLHCRVQFTFTFLHFLLLSVIHINIHIWVI